MLAGAIGGSIGSPFYLLKTQQQALSKIDVGYQHTGKITKKMNFSFKSTKCFFFLKNPLKLSIGKNYQPVWQLLMFIRNEPLFL